jgi:signal transduction histidine kinase
MKTILIIDDDESILAMYGAALEHAGYLVLTAGSGSEGVQLARRHLPDVVLSDINMPGLDGQSVLKLLRADAEVGPKQIVLMTGNARAITTRGVMELGADDLLIKPFSLDELLRCVEARLQRAEVHWRVGLKTVAELRANLRSTLPHEFFTPLAGMLGLVQVLRNDLAQFSPEEAKELLTNIEESGWRLHRAVRNYLSAIELESDLPPPPSHPPTLSADAFRQAVNAGIDAAIKRHRRERDLQSQLAAVNVAGNTADITLIVEELVDNACRFSRPGTPMTVSVDGAGLLRVTDQGRGMTEEQIRQIGAFRQFERKKYEQQGLGLGLVLVTRLAQKCGARFNLESQPGQTTTARVAFVPAAGPPS